MRRATISSLAAFLLAGCAFGFKGGGFPPDIRTVAVLPFENETADPAISQQVLLSVREAMERRLGLRAAGENQADAVVRGKVVRYEPDLPLAFTGTPTGNGTANTVQVTRRQVTVGISIEISDRKGGKTIYQGSLTADGEYDPGREADGRKKALDKLVNNIVTGAQSQW